MTSLTATTALRQQNLKFPNFAEVLTRDNEAIRAGLTVRNYGVFCDLGRYENPKANPSYIPISKTPFADGIPQAIPTKKA